jgi:hypothetical protein
MSLALRRGGVHPENRIGPVRALGREALQLAVERDAFLHRFKPGLLGGRASLTRSAPVSLFTSQTRTSQNMNSIVYEPNGSHHLGVTEAQIRAGLQADHGFVVAARLALDFGIRSFPCYPLTDALVCSCAKGALCEATGKHPRIMDWPRRASRNLHVIKRRQERFLTRNWSAATGSLPGKDALFIETLDVDGERGAADLDALCRDAGVVLPHNIWRVNSGRIGGGFHLHWRVPEGAEDLRSVTHVFGTAIDIRGYGGQVILPGSLHKNGVPYTWDQVPSEPPPFMPSELRSLLPLKMEDAPARERPRKIGSGAPKRDSLSHERGSRKIGDGVGFAGFQAGIWNNAIDYWRDSGVDASEQTVIDLLWELTQAAPKAPGRCVERYRPSRDGSDGITRAVRRARDAVNEERSQSEE